jgi:hypothetical protein
VLRWLMALAVLSGIVFRPGIGGARTPDWTPAFNPSGLIEDCAEPCHLWLIEDHTRVVTVDVTTPFSGPIRRVRYAADWVHGEPCPEGRVEIARRIAGYRSGFLQSLLGQGFCPHVTLDGISSDAPYLTSLTWNDVVFDAERSRMLTREEYDRLVVSPLRKILVSQEPSRWVTFSLFVGAAVQNADLLTREITILLADPNPSSRQETTDGDSAKAKSVLKVADAVTRNGNLVEALLNDIDSDPSRPTSPGYERLVDNLAGITSSVPTWGSPPVCANVDRIARHLPWGRDVKKDATFLATLSRCEAGSENLLRQSLMDERPVVVATGLRVWWAAEAGGRSAAGNIAETVMTLVINGSLPTAAAAPVYVSKTRGQSLIGDGSATEEVALGLSKLGLLSGTIERLNAAGRPDQVRALFDGLERGVRRLVR